MAGLKTLAVLCVALAMAVPSQAQEMCPEACWEKCFQVTRFINCWWKVRISWSVFSSKLFLVQSTLAEKGLEPTHRVGTNNPGKIRLTW